MKFRLEPVDWLLNPRHPHEPWKKPAARQFKASKIGKKLPPLAADIGFDEALVIWNTVLQRDIAAPLEDFATVRALAKQERYISAYALTLIAKLFPLECVAEWILAAGRV